MSGGESCKQKCECSAAPSAGALYVHVPLCRSKCRYCDFYSVPARRADAGVFVSAAHAELKSRLGHIRRPLGSVFVGGGTPTVLGAAALEALLRPLRGLMGERTEFTVEANPGTLDRAVIAAMLGAGVNRVSLGAQSMRDDELASLGRIHCAADTRAAVGELRRAGLANLSLDLIYGISGQSLESWRLSLREALDLGPDHLSCYALTIEPGTPLAADVAAGRAAEMDESLQRECYEAAREVAAGAGLRQYEISNFARPGFECRHNLTYWHNEPYVGIGPGAAGYVGGVRRTNAPDLKGYVEAARAAGDGPFEPPASACESLDMRGTMAETLMLGLRLIEGVSRAGFKARFGADPVEAFPASLGRYAAQGAVEITPTRVCLAPRVFFAANTVLADVLAER